MYFRLTSLTLAKILILAKLLTILTFILQFYPNQ